MPGRATIALAHQARLREPDGGYDPLLEERMEAVLALCAAHNTRIITNMGAANPAGAARKVAEIARKYGLTGLKVASVSGDDVLDRVRHGDYALLERPGQQVTALGNRILSANAYLGVAPIVQALAAGAQVVVTGRVADPAPFLAPLVHEFGWSMHDWARLGRGIVVGHLLECAGQVTGGYRADPGYKDMPDLARLGFPLAEVAEDGSAILTKVDGSGGCITRQTCTEQLLYELLDPANYLQPDVIANFTDVRFTELGPSRIGIAGGSGKPRPPTLKVSVGYLDSFIGEGQISYAGPGALARGRLALDIVAERLKLTGVQATETRFELIGVDAVHKGGNPGMTEADMKEPGEVRIRVVGRTESMREAIRIGNEVETLYTNGPAGGGGAWKSAREIVAVVSTLLPRELVQTSVAYEVA